MTSPEIASLLTSVTALGLAGIVLHLCRKVRVHSASGSFPAAHLPELRLRVHVISERQPLISWTADQFDKGASVEEPAAPLVEPPSIVPRRRFILDSLFLLDSYHYVLKSARPQSTQGFREEFHYAAGIQVDANTFVICHIVPVQFSAQSATRVRVADGSNIRALAALDKIGLPLVAHFHSHPGKGPDANHPSETDRRFQERLERGGHIAIGGIFTQDGHLRFFAGDPTRFVVDVQGNHFRKVEHNVYELAVADRDLSV